MRQTLLIVASTVFALAVPHGQARADEPMAANENVDLAKKLSNPVADLISVPFKLDYDVGLGAVSAAGRATYVVQPVIPISINDDWNVISRTILPYVDMQSPTGNGGGTSGLGDTLQSFFFSPIEPTSGGWIWAVGPAISLPTGNNVFGSGRWSLGPTAALIKQENGWTYGMLVNQLWSVGGSSNRARVSSAFVQPVLAYTTKNATTFQVNTETSMNWETSQATMPINGTVSQLTRVAGQPVSFLIGGRIYANRPNGGPDWGLRFQATLLFPK